MNLSLLRQELTRDEGYVNRPYKDTVGKWTVGVGWNLSDNGIPRELHPLCIKLGLPINWLAWNKAKDVPDEMIEALLDLSTLNAITDARNVCEKNGIKWDGLSDQRQRAITNMVFNLGSATFSKFKKTLNLMLHNHWDKAADEVLVSKWASQVGKRAQRISNMLRKG